MKITQIIIIFLVACLTVVVGDIRQTIANPKLIVKTECKPTVQPIPFSFPTNARVVLKDGDSRSGTVIDINSQDITIKKDRIVPEAIANIVRIKFQGDIWWPISSKPSKIRGDEVDMKGKPRRFQVRMDGLEWEDAEKGIAVIKHEAVVGVDETKGLPREMKKVGKSRYIVSEMEFELEQQILIITAASHSRKDN
ncbi:hypothetical protein [Okeania sp. SIO3B5]|uniref:hypothetical protein n=1 Tax=Okeania sp. SIO3B5 TaxID=2607811 RepID=UPI0025E32D9C|nr:hypothetical protein [Okeania sp. SIO3B5]